ncbi:lytic murein transglycosylase [Candidatus Pelagibacter ubique]|jgi:membrane-bound lytic murein transglycosylase B|uniref:lytic murein transglycosylase n=1 Tax=Pelagibacter ubique TaxID=198252 RepID=UPI0003800989|nr:lytic murein transglycosylase [Candidatus Pelagibacter ubique]MDA9076691.1 lytic murein transglycosylase [bacterium]MDA7446726.1 lytic murein transglycosylase [Candidatus Pelagibacter ubique]MDA7468946.1 lytic murein transglycosylase [Candidatus Pelagibacter ubique]MDA7475805.1 lytic murein transglycosylase [Candidatus Pelagibacter ubique]MDA9972749.1 lytic murein transglycosylase [Candidatus Pelagibacter ubique]
MNIIKYFIIIFFTFIHGTLYANEKEFKEWLVNFKAYALEKKISEKTFNLAMSDVVFLPDVIKYDRFQPEFYEDTKTYISKRTSKQKVSAGIKLYELNKDFINSVDNKFSVEKELLLALMGIETNFGTYVGKMDILSSLATLSYDQRRSDFFTKELITILQLIDEGKINHNILYGSWAGAFGFFQFMPSTIDNYAIDYDKNNIIELKSTKDSFASAANYINKIGWKKNQPCFIKVKLKENIPSNILNTSAKKIHNKTKFKLLKKYIINEDSFNSINENLIASIITPDKDIIPDAQNLDPAYIVFDNYEKILQWNRSLRFSLAVCTLKEKFENAL